LILSGNTLYGTASAGGTNGSGTVFALHTDGTGFTNLHDFTGVYSYPAYPYPYQYRGPPTNSDGANPQAGLVLSGNTLYGTAINGGSSGNGTVFAVTTDGTGFATLYSFRGPSCYGCPNSDGTSPFAGLIVSGSTLYGTASAGGILGNGTLFSASFLPQLIIIPSRTNVILTWPTNYDGFTLQSATNLGSQVFWTTVSAKPVVIAGQKVVINPISGTQQFFRLSQ
jgi:uncharacterized repeat protein (TIGR03803 family)